MVAQVVPIRREDYYFGTSLEENDNPNDLNNENENDNKTPKSLPSSNDPSRIKTYGGKYLKDRHSNVVLVIITNILSAILKELLIVGFQIYQHSIDVNYISRLIKVKFLEFIQQVKSIQRSAKMNLLQLLPFNQSIDQHISMEKVGRQIEIEIRLHFKNIERDEFNMVKNINIERLIKKYLT